MGDAPAVGSEEDKIPFFQILQRNLLAIMRLGVRAVRQVYPQVAGHQVPRETRTIESAP
jgi:hypothetical protein